MPALRWITIDCADPGTLGAFWREALAWEVTYDGPEGMVLIDPAGGRMPGVYLQRVAEPNVGKSRVHLDLWVDDVDTEVERLVALGATVLERRDRWDGSTFAVMADPEGTEFCVAKPLPG